MLYLSKFKFPDGNMEAGFLFGVKRTCYDTFYPFQIFPRHQFRQIDFEPITILYGGNGTGKSTALNVIAEKAGLTRDSIYNKSNFYEDYLDLCELETELPIPEGSRIITSDDVFDYMLNVRSLNQGIDNKREELFSEYLDNKYSSFRFGSIADYDRLKKVNKSRSKTQSRYVRSELMDNVREYSNGESAFRYFTEKMEENALYLLDEPENSLAPGRQLELVDYVGSAARFFGCQFVISTHSPFFLAMRGAKIYNLDDDPVSIANWTELENVQAYYRFFKEHEKEFL